MDDVTKALERLEQKLRARADGLYKVNPEMTASELKLLQVKAEGLDEAADELATLRQSLAGQGETKAQFCPCGKYAANPVIVQMPSTPRAAEAVTDEMVERLAKYIYQQEAHYAGLSLDEALRHQSNWARAIPEAREMLTAALTPPSAKGEL